MGIIKLNGIISFTCFFNASAIQEQWLPEKFGILEALCREGRTKGCL